MMMCVEANSAETLARRNCAAILRRRQAAASTATRYNFKCKSCNRTFGTFQALGGHRASHKKLRLTGDSVDDDNKQTPAAGTRFKVHECKECRIGFPTGQALGGHMRKHVDLHKRKRMEEAHSILQGEEKIQKKQIQMFPILSKQVVLNLDLNFPPPLEEYSFLQLV